MRGVRRRIGDAVRRNVDYAVGRAVERREHAEDGLKERLREALAVAARQSEAAIAGSDAQQSARSAALEARLAAIEQRLERIAAQTYVGRDRVLFRHPLGLQMLLDGRCRTVTPHVIAGRYETDLMALWPRLVAPGDRVLEIGANQGFHTLALATIVGSDGHLWAFEPHPRTVSILRENIIMNGYRGHVTIVEAAASDANGRRSFRALSEEPAGAHLASDTPDWTDALPGETIEVQTVDIGELAAQLAPAPTLVKIDAEGEELTILRRLLAALPPSTRRVFVVEALPGDAGRAEDLLGMATEHELQILAFQGRDGPEPVDADYVRQIGWEDILLAVPGRLAADEAHTSPSVSK